jgi:hypothetical protein
LEAKGSSLQSERAGKVCCQGGDLGFGCKRLLKY